MQHSRDWWTVKPLRDVDGSTTGIEGIARVSIDVWDDLCVVLIGNESTLNQQQFLCQTLSLA